MIKLFIRFLFWSLLIVASRLAFAEMVSGHGFNEVNPDIYSEEVFCKQDFKSIKPTYRGTRNIYQAQIESVIYNRQKQEERRVLISKMRRNTTRRSKQTSRIRGKNMTIVKIRGTKVSIDQLY